MFKRSICFLVTLVCVQISFAQSKEEMIKSIRSEFQAINSDTTLKTVRLDNEEFLEEFFGHMPDNGGSLTGFYKDGKVKKIVEWIGISWGVGITEYYFQDSHLIFVYRLFKAYGQDTVKMEHDYSRFDMISEDRYYFYNNKLISTITTGQNPLSENNFTPEDLPDGVSFLIELLKRKK